MKISLIVAMDNQRGIGNEGKMPWHLPEDLKYFKAKTLGKPIIMGKKTFLSIGKPLPGRKNIILTHDARFQASGCEIVFSIEEALHAAQPCEEVMIIGGSSLYQQMLDRAQTIYLTKINKIFTADTFFPEWDEQEWVEESCETHHNADFEYSFFILRRSCPKKNRRCYIN